MKNGKSRRQFLKNVSLASLSIGLLPKLSQGETLKSEKAQATCDKTTLDYYGEGPFYTTNPPEIEDSKLAKVDEKGTKLILSGRVMNLDCTEFIPDTIVDIWHANEAGEYDNTGYNLRGKVKSNSEGFYVFETIKPGKYLNGSKYRPSHIHFKITAPGKSAITTQLYFEGDTDIQADAAASIKSGQFDASHRIIPITKNPKGEYEGTWDIVIDGDGVTGINDLHIDKGMLYEANPNPFKDKLLIKYGVFKESKVGLIVFDAQGRTVATLKNEILKTEKYEAEWKPDYNLPNGYYFVALKINDLQVHYRKVLRNK